MIDLRSDTAMRPQDGMRQAMARAEVGDEQRGEDPTTLALEERVADLLGQERALLVPTATMANQIALCALTRPADEVLVAADAHIARSEAGGPAVHGGLTVARCASPASSRQPASTRSITTSSASPRTTPTPAGSPRG